MTRSVRQLLKGSQQWRNTLPALRSFVTTNYNQPNPHNQAVMATPPTIATSSVSTLLSGLSQSSIYPTSDFAYSGGRAEIFGGTYRRVIPATRSLAAGFERNAAWRIAKRCNAQKVGFQVLGDTQAYRFVIDGKYVSLTGTTTTTTSGANYITLDFGVKADRLIEIEAQNQQGFQGFYIAPGDTFASVSSQYRMFFAGDSFVGASTGATFVGDGFAPYCADMLGVRDFCMSGVGSTGWAKPGTANDRYTLGQRITDITTTGPWDVIVIPMGLNDIGLSTSLITGEVNLALRQLRQAFPAAQIFVIGPWDVNAPAAPVANFSATKAAIQAGFPIGAGINFLDPEGVSFTKSDLTHPDTSGHATLGAWAALAIKNALGA